MSDPALSNGAPQPKPKKTKLTLAIVGCAFLALAAVLLGPTLLLPKVMERFAHAQREKAKLDVQALVRLLDKYAAHNGGAYPQTLEALLAPDPAGEVLLKVQALPRDPWTNPYVYLAPALDQPRRVVSYGKDGRPGGEGADADIDSATLGDD
ncbi:MAG: type II secretion system protein GspG [Planctomycetota bacterium]|nr:type II secretion system protein GspG [Planctomycetota bacterium]